MIRYVVQTFGCQMNVHDSDRMEGVLRAHGGTPVEDLDSADVVIFNTCSVREKAEMKLRSELGKLAEQKQRNPELVLVVAGCVAQQEGKALLADAPYLDLVIGPDNIAELPSLLRAQQAGAPPTARTVFDLAQPTFLPAMTEPGEVPASAFVTTMKGCDERCSFCIVPTTRGPERYRPSDEIVSEVRRWVECGSREVVLLGQTVDSYRDPNLPPPLSDDPDESQFPALLEAIYSRVPGLSRLRYTSPHPRHVTPSLAKAHQTIPILAQHVHLPVQSGSDRILRRMIRRHTRAEYLERIALLREAVSGITFSTDLIVGFPGETAEDFESTLSLVEEVGFVSLFAFKYSARPGTPALRLGDDVTESEKSERLTRLLELSSRLTESHLLGLVGSEQTVLVEGHSKSGDCLVQGRSRRSEIVHVRAGNAEEASRLLGRVVRVHVLRANKHSLESELLPGEIAKLREGISDAPSIRLPKRRRMLPVTQS